MAKILVVEDEIAISDLLKISLQLVGHVVTCLEDGAELTSTINNFRPDLILLDVMLPGRDGFKLINEIDKEKCLVIFITAKESVDDRIYGLKLGADDYIVKPFATIEVLARVDNVLKRFKKIDAKFVLEDLEIRFDQHQVFLKNKMITLTPKEFDLLKILIKHQNIALSRDQLLDLVWGYDYYGDSRTVDVHIQKLRQKLNLYQHLKTIFKVGYRLETSL